MTQRVLKEVNPLRRGLDEKGGPNAAQTLSDCTVDIAALLVLHLVSKIAIVYNPMSF